MQDIRQRLLAIFQIEHRDHVEQIRSLLALIEKTGGRAQGPELDEAFRRAHSLKGAARAVDLPPVEGLAHRLETLLARVRKGTMPLGHEVASVVNQALDASEDCVMALGDHRPTPGFDPAIQALERLLERQPEPEVSSSTPVREVPVESQPGDRAEGGSDAGKSEAESPLPIAAFQPLEMVRITPQNFDGILRSAGGFVEESQRQVQLSVQLQDLTKQIASLEKELDRVRRHTPGTREFGKLRTSLDSSRRQVHTLAAQARSARGLQQRSSWAIQRLGKQLQLDIWRARMVPSESLLEGYRKSMRDLARDENKEIAFSATSTGGHADRRILEAVKDPLLHLLRNAVSHGIESAQERVAHGKPATGSVALRVGSTGRQLIITIEDDGRGVDFARAEETARGQGFLSENETASRDRLSQILFQPGFSTSPAVTSLSGRGMGLSVVHEAVRRLQGSVELEAREGGGTVIRMTLPLSIATHRLLLIDCGGQTFAVPVHAIARLERIAIRGIATVEGRAVISFEDQTVPIVKLRQALGINSGSPSNPPDQELLPVVVLRIKQGLIAVAVDAFLWENEAVIQDLGSAARRGIGGAVLLDNGSIAMVLNPEELLRNSDGHRQDFTPRKMVKTKCYSILVVDDSMTTRTLEKSILEAHGYRVRVAVDGMDALASLRKERADLVITDVQMPRMDGFGLLGAMKEDRELNQIPVIVVTSLERREDQERGLCLGADAYIVKRKFDQGELLATIRQIL